MPEINSKPREGDPIAEAIDKEVFGLRNLLDWFADLQLFLNQRVFGDGFLNEHQVKVDLLGVTPNIPATITNEGMQVYVTDAVGGKGLFWSDGTNWRRVKDDSLLS